MKYYPAFINLNQKKCVVVGGGKIAYRKAVTLVKAGARVLVISPEITKNLRKLSLQKKITYKKKRFGQADLRGAFLVIGATNQRDVNEKIRASYQKKNMLVNIVDNPGLGNFIVPSTVSRGHLQIAVSTNGISPALAKKIRKQLEEDFGGGYRKLLDFLAHLRPVVLREIDDEKKRQRVFNRLVEARLMTLLTHGRVKQAYALAARIIRNAKAL